jgi:cell division protein FtsQ
MAERAKSSRTVRSRGAEMAAANVTHRRGVVIAAALTMVVVGGAMAWLAMGSVRSVARTLPVERVVFVSAGRERLTEVNDDALQRIADAVRTRGTNMLDIDLPGLRAAVKKTEWVREAEVRRIFPATIEVAIDEHRPAARWLTAGMTGEAVGSAGAYGAQTQMLNTFGDVFAAVVTDERKSALPQLSGPDGSAVEVLTRYVALKGALSAIERVPVGLSLSARRAWRLTLDNGTSIELGRHDDELRVARFMLAHAEVPALRAANAQVDMRYVSGFTILKTSEPNSSRASPDSNARVQTRKRTT